MSTTAPDTASQRQEIDRARQQMGRALFQLADRLAPKKLIPRVKEQAKLKASAKLAELKEKVSPARAIKRKVSGEPEAIPARGYESNGGRVKELTSKS
jgi:hypothetical protein